MPIYKHINNNRRAVYFIEPENEGAWFESDFTFIHRRYFFFNAL